MSNGRYSNKPFFTQLGLVTVVAVLIGGFAVTPGYGQATPTTTTESVPISISGSSVCGGEFFELSGQGNFVVHTTVGPDGEFQTSISHVTLQATGVGSESGDRYRLAETQNAVTNVRQTSANEIIGQTHGTLIRQGSEGENAVVEIQFRLITNANGEVTATADNVDVNCVG